MRLSRRPLLTATIDLYGGSGGAVAITPGTSRWPEREGADRLALPAWLAALTLAVTSRPLSARVRHRLMAMAAALIEDPEREGSEQPWADSVAGRALVAPDGEGQPRIVVQIVDSAHGPAPQCVGSPPGPITLAAATAAVAGVALDGAEHGVLLSAALAIEGVLAWDRRGWSRRESPARGAADALSYAIARLEEAASPVPEALAVAASAHRRGNGGLGGEPVRS